MKKVRFTLSSKNYSTERWVHIQNLICMLSNSNNLTLFWIPKGNTKEYSVEATQRVFDMFKEFENKK